MGWTAKVKDSVSYAAMTTESAALAYKIVWQMNKPATVSMLINDDSGAKTQTYGSAYIGTGTILLEQPTNTEIFRGRITGTESNVQNGVLTLRGEDWLSQLDDRLVNYDTREILDPNSDNDVREYELRPYLDDGLRCNAIWEAAGNTNIRLAVDDLGDWTADDYNTLKICFPYTHLGEQTDTCFAYDETVTATNGAPGTDLPAAGEANTWVDDGSVHQVSHNRGADSAAIIIEYDFHTLCVDSTLVGSVDQMTIKFVGKCTSLATAGSFSCAVWDYNLGAYYWIGWDRDTVDTDMVALTVTVPVDRISDLVDSDGDMKIRLGMDGGTGTSTLHVDYLAIELEYTVTTALSANYTIDDTVVSAGVYNHLDIDGELMVTAGVVDWWRFFITDKLSVYVTDLVNTYDELYALDATTSVTAGTKYVGRHYHRQSPLKILQDLSTLPLFRNRAAHAPRCPGQCRREPRGCQQSAP